MIRLQWKEFDRCSFNIGPYSLFSWHLEDGNLNSINYLHRNAAKVFYSETINLLLKQQYVYYNWLFHRYFIHIRDFVKLERLKKKIFISLVPIRLEIFLHNLSFLYFSHNSINQPRWTNNWSKSLALKPSLFQLIFFFSTHKLKSIWHWSHNISQGTESKNN